MRLILRFVFDWTAVFAAGKLALPHGLGWAVIAMLAVAVYGGWCFRDGMQS